MFQTNWASEALFAVSRAAIRELQRREPSHPARTSSNRDLGWALYTRRKRAHVPYVHTYIYPPIFPYDLSTNTDEWSHTRERALHPVYARLRIKASGEHRRRLTPRGVVMRWDDMKYIKRAYTVSPCYYTRYAQCEIPFKSTAWRRAWYPAVR